MTDQAQQNLKVTDQAAEKSVQKTPEAVNDGGVIAAQPNQEVHGQAFASTHQNDKTLSEPDLIAMEEGETVAQYKARVAQIQANRFGFFDSAAVEPTVYEKRANQAVEPPPPVHLNDSEFQSSVKLNVQITNVPEVSEGVKPEEALQHLNQVFEAGEQTVRPIKEWMATPNAVSDALVSIGPALDNAVNYFANTPGEQVKQDTEALLEQTADALDKTFAYAHTSQERARVTGNLMPMFFFEGNAKEPISPQAVEQMGLETLSTEELNSLGINRLIQETSDLHMPEIPEHLRNLDFPPITGELVQSMEQKGRTIVIGEPGSRVWSALEKVGANAKVIYPWCDEIMVKSNAPRVALWEEFLHGTQQKLGLLDLPEIPMHYPEIHVKDFMLRHSKMLGLTENEITLLEELKARAINGLNQEGYRWTGK